MERRALGRTGLDVSIVSFGTAPLGGLFGSVDDSDTAQIVDEVLDSGINLIDTSPYYGLAEERLGRALTPSKRDKVILATKAGRYGIDDFDFSPKRIRESLDNSLRLMGTDYVDIFQLHDIEFVELNSVFEDGLAELHALKDAGKCRFIGMTGYPVPTFRRVIQETDLDVVLTYAKSTLLDDAFTTELLPLAEEKGVGMMNAAAVALGLLTLRVPGLLMIIQRQSLCNELPQGCAVYLNDDKPTSRFSRTNTLFNARWLRQQLSGQQNCRIFAVRLKPQLRRLMKLFLLNVYSFGRLVTFAHGKSVLRRITRSAPMVAL